MWWPEFLFVVFFAMGWWPCCCAANIITCSTCINTTGYTSYTVVISGVADATCSNCSNYNGTWVVTEWASRGSRCEWSYENVTNVSHWDGSVCVDPYTSDIFMEVKQPPFSNHFLNVYLGANATFGNGLKFASDLGASKPSCNFSSKNVPFSSDMSEVACTAASATCTVTYIP